MYKNFLKKSLAFLCAFILLTVSLAVGTPASANELLSSDKSGNMLDKGEIENRLNPIVFDAYTDPDNDELPNVDEFIHHTIPTGADGWDSDDDNMPDAWEVRYDLNPIKADATIDSDNDGLTNYEEYTYSLPLGWAFSTHGIWWNGTNPTNWDTDGDKISDKDEINNWYTYEKIQAEYYFDNSVVFSDNYFISSDNSAVHLDGKTLKIPFNVRWNGSYNFFVYVRFKGTGYSMGVVIPEKSGSSTFVSSISDKWNSYSAYSNLYLTIGCYNLSVSTASGTIVQVDYILIEKKGLDPLNPDVDNDGLYDGYDITDDYGNVIKGEKSHNCFALSSDTDRDGMPDGEEVRNGLNPNPEHLLT
ncbi:MAG: hypothetical protein QMC80_05825 [Thermoplasmatales archaeon]|nr:hypothetical protein [Thermoplasmatales archaeon]